MTDNDNERRFTAKMTLGDQEIELSNLRIQTRDEVHAELMQQKAEAPDTEYLTDSKTCDIDEVIAALQAAKDRGVDTVYVNDDGQTRHFRPRLTNNIVGRSPLAPPPDDLHEYVEL